ncbi:unnamed protein product [Nippostrongylus brasiliensis]|uniref:TPR_REGION domain-containing protein n=1 Tax=Nippostrongylus brasiliensis TaxID=27835 RepID=A0A0N4XE87_NIPBR|nr:unnamed protein product [Nippostrongylus brasiliensis]
MNTFQVDDIMLTFDELKPFSDVLHDETQLAKLHKVYKNLDKYDDASLLRYVLVLASFMENSLQTDPPLTRALQNHLVELTSLIEKTKHSVSKDYTYIAMGILFKYSGALLDVQRGTDIEVSLILHSLAYHHLSLVSLTDPEVSAWIALHLLETTAAITYNDVSEDEVVALWNRDDLAEYCVDNIIPAEGRIQRLHAGVYREGIGNCSTVWPAITVKRIKNLFNRLIPVLRRPEVLRLIVWMIGHDNTFEEMSLFDEVLAKSPLSKSTEPDSGHLTGTDVKVFLVTLSIWCDSSLCPARVPGRLRIRGDHNNCWNALCQLISNTPDCESVKFNLLRSRVIDSVRLHHRVVCLKRLYEVFRWLDANDGNEWWLNLYATAIRDTITGTYSCRRKCDDLFPDGVTDYGEFTVDEVDRIEEHVSRHIASSFLRKGDYGEAERRLIFANSFASKKLLIEVYEAWLQDGHLEERDREQLLKRVRELQSLVSDVAEESFFSAASGPTNVVDRSFASAIASPIGIIQQASENKAVKATEVKNSMSTQKTPLGQSKDVLSMTESRSITFSTPTAPNRTAMKSEGLPVLPKGESSALPKAVEEISINTSTGSSAATGFGAATTVSTVPPSSVPGAPAIITTSPIGKFIANKEAATSFWKSGKSAAPIFGALPPCLSSSQQKGSTQQNLTCVTNLSTSLNSPHSAPNLSGSTSRTTISFASATPASSQALPQPDANVSQSKSDKSLEDAAAGRLRTPLSSVKTEQTNLTLHDVTVGEVDEQPDDDANFYNNLMMEMCQKQLARGSKNSLTTNTSDLTSLEEKMQQMKVRVKNADTQLHSKARLLPAPSSVPSASAPTQAELMREWQKGAVIELEQRVAALVGSRKVEVRGSPSSSLTPGASALANVKLGDNLASVPQRTEAPGCSDPMGLFRGLLASNSRVARHPGSNGICFGCLDDDTQDRALKALDQLAIRWNTAVDSDEE